MTRYLILCLLLICNPVSAQKRVEIITPFLNKPVVKDGYSVTHLKGEFAIHDHIELIFKAPHVVYGVEMDPSLTITLIRALESQATFSGCKIIIKDDNQIYIDSVLTSMPKSEAMVTKSHNYFALRSFRLPNNLPRKFYIIFEDKRGTQDSWKVVRPAW